MCAWNPKGKGFDHAQYVKCGILSRRISSQVLMSKEYRLELELSRGCTNTYLKFWKVFWNFSHEHFISTEIRGLNSLPCSWVTFLGSFMTLLADDDIMQRFTYRSYQHPINGMIFKRFSLVGMLSISYNNNQMIMITVICDFSAHKGLFELFS